MEIVDGLERRTIDRATKKLILGRANEWLACDVLTHHFVCGSRRHLLLSVRDILIGCSSRI